MYVFFISINGVVMQHAIPKGTTITGTYYSTTVLPLLQKKLKKLNMLPSNLHHDNAPVHRSGLVFNAIQELEFNILPHPPYSPDLAL